MSNKTDSAWEKIFRVKNFDISKDAHYISAKEIKNITGEEARIMAKHDHSRHLPAILKKHGYFILPVKNGEYILVRGNGFHEIENISDIEVFESKLKFQPKTAGRGESEMQYLDYAHYSGAIENVLKTGSLYPSIRGREFSKPFDFKIGSLDVSTQSVQIEVDAGFEGENDLVLTEAKMGTPKDFIIRQLFYPYRHYLTFGFEKNIKPVFFAYDKEKELYNFWIYEFSDPYDYNSLNLLKQKSVKIRPVDPFKVEDVTYDSIDEKEIVPPQADDLDKVVELIFKVSEGVNNSEEIARHFKFTNRQSSYYRQAAESLGFAYYEKGFYYLTELGNHFVGLPALDRSVFMTQQISKFILIKKSLDLLYKKKTITKADLYKIIESNSMLTGSTIKRRTQTLYSWLKWIGRNTGIIYFEKNTLTISD